MQIGLRRAGRFLSDFFVALVAPGCSISSLCFNGLIRVIKNKIRTLYIALSI
jgi:hypothetical protein